MYRKAADLGEVAMYNLGNMYAEGRGVARDKEAAKWYEKAAALGHEKARQELRPVLHRRSRRALSPSAPDFNFLLLQCIGGACPLRARLYLILTACFRAGWPFSGTCCLATLA